VGQYDGMLKDQLRELCLKRGLNVSGTVAELVARLEGADAAQAQADGQEPDLLAEAGLSETGLSDDNEPAQAPPPITHPAPEPAIVREPESTEPPVNRTVHRARFECGRGVLPTEDHERFLRATEFDAMSAGYAIRGSAQRISFQEENGKRYAVYEVTLGRPRQGVR